MKSEIDRLINSLESLGDPVIAEHSQRFFKTGKGQYGEGDLFLGIRVPVIRAEAKKFLRQMKTDGNEFSIDMILDLLGSKWHEVRLFSLLLMVEKYKKGDDPERASVYKAYLANARRVNNWDLVDLSAHHIVGPYLEKRDRSPLYRLARSKDLWEKRISIISTYHFIRNEDYEDTLAISEILLQDTHDLIHKAVGWMLREVGNRDGSTERAFLGKHYQVMPRTMLRYAIEKFPERERKAYLKGEV